MTQDGRAEELEPAKRRIMEATYRALQKRGYGNLTTQDIADEFENSKALLYYHYDGKDELLVDFLDYVLAEFLDGLPRGDRTPREELETLVDALLPETLSEEAYRLQLSMFELRMNARHDEAYRAEYRHIDDELTAHLRDILVRGIEAGEFEAIDPDAEAELFLSILTGTRARRVTVFEPDESIESLRAAIDSHIDRISA
ncbi:MULTISPECIES: TetR/AcrR family transcriptional regulator [Haloferax]|uniref:Transcriptional regulator BetI n=1 Tax=Haloferax massiliensis TaxID=1476858 RepID=A0A0D6JVY3_9EURY|nr:MULTISPECIES: TetR/AcrR family transcriptional regulator [Haloferax]MDS0242413.1 TetR family transcriptional regulator [Haloferax sp. S2CR25]MDS0445534.1 TetR family transcriptional regulator [Haloferax sp. S2CR25-2]CQR52774.1 transcriptional regulator BetI [Haloferax massiliensis]